MKGDREATRCILRAKEACGQKDLSLTPHAEREPYRDRNRNTEKDRHTQA